MSDIVERLRGTVDIRVMREAADEIERLRILYEQTRAELKAALNDRTARNAALEEAAQAAEINNQHWITGIDRAIRSLKEKI